MRRTPPISIVPFVLAAALPLAACSPAGSPPPPPAAGPAAAGSSAPSSLIGRKVDEALAHARKELREGNISLNGDLAIDVNGHRVRRPDAALPKAEITPQGDLLVDGKPVAIDAAQRRQLLDYRQHVIALAEAGIAIGGRGVDIAGEALGGALGAAFGGEQARQDFERRMQAKSDQIEAEARKLCVQLPPLMALQQSLAASLPAFKPYATMTQADIDDCGKSHAKGSGVAVTAAGG